MNKNEIIEKMLNIIQTCIGIKIYQNQFDEDLANMGIDSISFIQIIVALEEELDIEIPDEKLLLTEMNTFSKMVDVISAVLNENKDNSNDE